VRWGLRLSTGAFSLLTSVSLLNLRSSGTRHAVTATTVKVTIGYFIYPLGIERNMPPNLHNSRKRILV